MQLRFHSIFFLATSLAAVAENAPLIRGTVDNSNDHRELKECVTQLIDFEEFPAGRVPTDLGNGVTVQGISRKGAFPAMVFDTSKPTGGNTDLFSNTLGKVLILSEDGKSSEPDDAERGGHVAFTFDPPVSEVVEIGLLGFDARRSYVTGVRSNGRSLGRTKVPVVGAGDHQILPYNKKTMSEISVYMRGGGAITSLEVKRCVPSPKVSRVHFKGHHTGETPSDLGRGASVVAKSHIGGYGAMIFNTKTPTGGDFDLESDIGKVLIISEDGNADDPNDTGGLVTFTFDPPLKELINIDVIDFEGNQNKLFGQRADKTKFKIFIPGTADGVFQTVPISEFNVKELKVEIKFSGAIAGMDVIYADGV